MGNDKGIDITSLLAIYGAVLSTVKVLYDYFKEKPQVIVKSSPCIFYAPLYP